ncbi:glucose-1-phosphate cytidylyltransferase [bacterium]|nr:glucose-1-phosphate cytidylyltransferase [bacterium]MCI0602003.1 glucose-1-phosphate cytidylyltransferase [bacterium]
MKVIVLAGGRGTRISEESNTRPKPLVEVGGKPLLWHILNIYSAHGFKEFLIACGYKGEMIKEYFHNFQWQRVDVIDTGLDTMTGGRMLKLRSWIENETFLMTYGDGVANVDIQALVAFHRSHGKLVTVTAVHPPARFGELHLDGNLVQKFSEKPQTHEGWINGGFFVLEPEVLSYIAGDETSFEREPMEHIARDQQMMAFRHDGFWQPVDTLREKELLDHLWESGNAPWKIW